MKIDGGEIISFGRAEFSSANDLFENPNTISSLFPEGFDIDQNPDVFPFVAPLAIANKFNRNGEGIDYAGALQIKEKLMHKYVDYEHNNKNIIGVMLNAGFSKIDTGEVFEGDPSDPFYVNVAALLYKQVNPSLITRIMSSSDVRSHAFGSYSTSWEIIFETYDIALGSSDLKQCEIVSNPSHKAEFKKFLKVHGGSGYTDDNIPVFKLLRGELTPIGIGIVHKPAAFVKGIYGIESEDSFAFETESAKKIFDMAANNSQLKNNDVNLDRTDMDEILALLKKIEAAVKKPDEGGESSASLTKLFAEKVKEKDQEWRESIRVAEQKAKEEQDAKEQLAASVSNLTSELEATKLELNSLKESAEASAANEIFNARMEQIDSTFKLNDDLRKIVASDLKALNKDEASFSAYLERTKVLLQGREKTEDETQKIALASALLEKVSEGNKLAVEDIKEILSTANIEIQEIPNTTEPETDITTRFKQAFGKDQIKIEL